MQTKGVLKKSGWQKVGKYWYYLKDYKVVTNKSIKRGKVNGRLDSQGRFTTGWVVISDYNDKVKYIDPGQRIQVSEKYKQMDWWKTVLL